MPCTFLGRQKFLKSWDMTGATYIYDSRFQNYNFIIREQKSSNINRRTKSEQNWNRANIIQTSPKSQPKTFIFNLNYCGFQFHDSNNIFSNFLRRVRPPALETSNPRIAQIAYFLSDLMLPTNCRLQYSNSKTFFDI